MKRYGGRVPRKPTDNDATKNLRPDDERQDAPKETKIGKLRRSEVLADFRKIARGQRGAG